MNADLTERLDNLSTAHLADACLRVGVPMRCAPAGMAALNIGMHCTGRACPVRHVGSVDIFFEALETARPADVLVVDNGGRLDEACLGDLVALEVQKAGLHGIVIWGLHRDTDELRAIGLPVFSLGAMPGAPQRLDARWADGMESARVGPWNVSSQDVVIGDSDGVIFVPEVKLEVVVAAAASIKATEHGQAAMMQAGISFRRQVRFAEYLSSRTANPAFAFRQHLRKIGAAIEE